MNDTALQLLGTGLIALYMTSLIVLSTQFQSGQVRPVCTIPETLNVVIAFLGVVVITRLLITAGVIDQLETRIINGLLAAPFLVINIQLILLNMHPRNNNHRQE